MRCPTPPTVNEERRLGLFAGVVGLNRDDERILRLEMIRLYTVITPIRERLSVSRTGVPVADLATYREARLQSYGRLLETLSQDGRNRLNAYIERQKRNTKVVTGSQSR